LNVFELGPAEQLAWLFELLRVHACACVCDYSCPGTTSKA
jgi:hypothetical protein